MGKPIEGKRYPSMSKLKPEIFPSGLGEWRAPKIDLTWQFNSFRVDDMCGGLLFAGIGLLIQNRRRRIVNRMGKAKQRSDGNLVEQP